MGDRGPAATSRTHRAEVCQLIRWEIGGQPQRTAAQDLTISLSDGRSGASRNGTASSDELSVVYPMGDRGPAATRPLRVAVFRAEFIRWEIGGQPQPSATARRNAGGVYPMGDRGPAAITVPPPPPPPQHTNTPFRFAQILPKFGAGNHTAKRNEGGYVRTHNK